VLRAVQTCRLAAVAWCAPRIGAPQRWIKERGRRPRLRVRWWIPPRARLARRSAGL